MANALKIVVLLKNGGLIAMKKNKIIVKCAFMLTCISIIILHGTHLLYAQKIILVKTQIVNTDTLGDICTVKTLHGDFYINEYATEKTWNNNKITRIYKILTDAEKNNKYIIIHYTKDRYILDITYSK